MLKIILTKLSFLIADFNRIR